MSVSNKQGNVVSGIFLVAGTCVGAGMLAIPVVTASGGFFPAMVTGTLCWLFMLCTGLLFLEATLWMPEGANVLSMSKRYLGTAGRWVGGLSFLFLYYCLLISYISGGAPLLMNLLPVGDGATTTASILTFTLVMGFLVFLGTVVADRINWIMMVGAIGAFVLLLVTAWTDIQVEYLFRMRWRWMFFAAPTLFSAYGYHNIIPTMTFYLKRNVRQLRWAIIIGSTVPYVVYSLWQWMILGSLSSGELADAAASHLPITYTLQKLSGHRWVSIIGGYFGFFAIVTSFIGVSLSMIDFLGDGFQCRRTGFPRFLMCLLVFFPPALFAVQNPDVFVDALGYAGGFGEAILNGFFPIAMVWVGRYHLKLQRQDQLPGGRPLLMALLLFCVAIIALEVMTIIG